LCCITVENRIELDCELNEQAGDESQTRREPVLGLLTDCPELFRTVG